MAEQRSTLVVMEDAADFIMFEAGNTAGRDELLHARNDVAALIETQRDTLRMLEAAHRQLGMWTHLNKRIQRAKDALARVSGGAK